MSLARSLICQAIRERKRFSMSYGGSVRIVEPHAHGVSTAGNEVLRALEVGLTARPSAEAKLWLVSKMAQLVILPESFEPGSEYQENDLGMMRVHCELCAPD